MVDSGLTAMALAAAAMASVVGMAWLALAMPVHWAQCRGLPLAKAHPPQRVLRVMGALALLAALALCLWADRPSIAVLVWVMLQTGSAFAVAFALGKRPAWLRVCWPWL